MTDTSPPGPGQSNNLKEKAFSATLFDIERKTENPGYSTTPEGPALARPGELAQGFRLVLYFEIFQTAPPVISRTPGIM